MRRGWEVQYENGTTINENQMDWKSIPKIGMKRLTLHFEGKQWDITNKPAYIQKKRASMVPGQPETFQVESRSIGYYEDNKKIWFTVNESTGQMKIETVDIEVQ